MIPTCTVCHPCTHYQSYYLERLKKLLYSDFEIIYSVPISFQYLRGASCLAAHIYTIPSTFVLRSIFIIRYLKGYGDRSLWYYFNVSYM